MALLTVQNRMAERPISIVSPKFVDFTEASWSLGGGSHAPRGKEQIIEGLISASISTDNLGDLTSWYYLNGNPSNRLLDQIDEVILSLVPGQVILPSTKAGIALQIGADTGQLTSNDNEAVQPIIAPRGRLVA